MSRLETSVKGPVSSLVQGRELTIDPFTQVPVAAWVFKTCLVLETTNISGRKLWPEAFRQFRHHKLAPTHAEIWLGAYQHRDNIGRYLASVDTKVLPDGREVTGFRATMAIGAAFFNVFLARDASGEPITAHLHFREHIDRLTRFSPPNLSFVHPPRGGPFSEAEFETMAVEPAPWSIGFPVAPHASP